ncbi:hypothetical protein A3I53_03670 [Candidatus Curtissbacteria bacterium RIFCSPLOWO2_02_FULL_40_13b]|nr:MAG: hypothetical protein A3I53_03670 [Candidatus Curtissbacteria bacterium RIFCSPLOWO2_02_FULL_40_13b]
MISGETIISKKPYISKGPKCYNFNSNFYMERETFVFFDIDNTLVRGFSILPFAQFLTERGLFHQDSYEKMLADFACYSDKKLDYREFAITIVDQYSEGLRGYRQEDIESASQEYLTIYLTNLLPFSRELVELMNSQGKTVALSGAPKEAFIPLAQVLRIQQCYLLEAEVQNGIYTGKTGVNMALDTQKAQVIAQIKESGFNPLQSFAFGDSEHDLPLLESVSNPFAVSPNEELSRISTERGWPIVSTDNIIDQVKMRLEQLKSPA